MKGLNFCRMFVLFVVVLGLLTAEAVAQDLPASDQTNQNTLRVLDPQQWWDGEQGTIEEAVVSVRPKGVYMEYELYLTFSGRDTHFAPGIPLEVEFFFTLPEEAIVTDSWLWIGDDIIRAELMDTWTASDIYEDIVDRQRDPSILFKRAQGQYELRVYPMDVEEPRRVKITYLLPARWMMQQVQAVLPNHLLESSRFAVDELVVMTWPEGEWQDPFLLENESVSFQSEVNDAGHTYEWARLSDGMTDGPLTLAYPPPVHDDMYLGHKPGDGREGWYQLALQPFDVEGMEQNVLFLVDYDATKTSQSAQSVLDAVRHLVLTRFAAADSFNVMLSRLDIEKAADHWLAADGATVGPTFEELESKIGTYSNLPALLKEGLQYVEAQGSGSIFLISSSDQFGSAESANSLLDDVAAVVETMPPIYVLDLTDRNFNSYWVGDRRFSGNEYFYNNLTKLTAGSYAHMRDGRTLTQGVERVYQDLSSQTGTMDLHTTLSGGFCYGRHTLNSGSNGSMVSDEFVLQVGKCYGDFPFVAELSGLVDEEPQSKHVVRSLEEASEADSTLATLWSGLRIQVLERGAQTNEVVSEIVDYSLSERVLSLYTAFLALEEEQGGEVCASCRDISEPPPATDTEPDELLSTEVQVAIYPNPFRDRVTVVLTLPGPVEASEVSFDIYDVMGRRVRTLQPNQAGPSRRFELTWGGRDDAGSPVAAGTYLLVVTTPEGRYTRGITLVR